MSSSRALPPHAFQEVFPFHLWLDGQSRVVQFGAVLGRLIPELGVGRSAFEVLTLAGLPAASAMALDAAALCEGPGALVLEHPRTGMRLRGQAIALEDSGVVLLLAPWITDVDELDRWGLSVSDFPVHSAMAEQLGLIRELRTSVARVEQQRRALLESQHRIATHLRHMPLAVIDWDTRGRVAAWNPAAAKIFGIPAAEAIGCGTEILRMLGPVDDPADEAFDLLTTRNRRVVVEHRTIVGPNVLCAWHNTPLADVDGNPIGVSSIVRDVTESVRAERATRESQKLESLGLFAGGIAHDFNNLLAALLGNIELALAEVAPSSSLARHLREITTIAERGTELTKRLLDYSGRATYELEPISLAELVAEVRPQLAVAVGQRARLRVRVGGELPRISGDLGQLRQVIVNLVVNGSEAIGDRDGEVQLSTDVVVLHERLDDPRLRGGPLEPGTYVRVAVEDDGVGMSSELLSRVFDPFFSTKFTGRGLGLPAILGIVRGHRGGLRVDSSPGRGTCFELLFPALDPLSRPRESGPSVAAVRSSKGRLLVVDDEAQVRRVLTTALIGAGFDVVSAAAGNTALELYDNDPGGFDLVLTDLTMPGLDGHELFAALTTRDPQLPVILSSGYSEHQGTARYPDGTPATFLKKPFRLGHLLAKVHEELGKRTG